MNQEQLTEEAKKAIEEWTTHYLWNPKFVPVDGYYFRGLPIVLFFKEGDVMPWSVQYAGSGTYFETEAEARKYFIEKGRKKRRR